jgi:hypothetical protein
MVVGNDPSYIVPANPAVEGIRNENPSHNVERSSRTDDDLLRRFRPGQGGRPR